MLGESLTTHYGRSRVFYYHQIISGTAFRRWDSKILFSWSQTEYKIVDESLCFWRIQTALVHPHIHLNLQLCGWKPTLLWCLVKKLTVGDWFGLPSACHLQRHKGNKVEERSGGIKRKNLPELAGDRSVHLKPTSDLIPPPPHLKPDPNLSPPARNPAHPAFPDITA